MTEKRGGKLFGYEFKRRPSPRMGALKAWHASYPRAEFEVITPQDYLDWAT